MRLKPRLLARDALAGVLATGVLIPSALAYALLAGLPPEAGLAALVLPPLVYGLLASSRYISVSPTGQVSALVAIGVGGLAAGDPVRYAALAATLALMVGGLLVAAGLLRLGFLTDFISRPVLIGYGLGAALTVITSQLPALLGLKVDGIRFSQVFPRLLGALDGLRPLPALFGLGCLAVYFIARRWVRVLPPALVTLGVAAVVVAGFHLDERGLAVVGALPRGRLTLGLPAISLADARALLPVALVIFLLVFLDSNSLGRGLATKHDAPLNVNRELHALGAMNVAAGLVAAFPVSANSSSSRIYEVLGARTFVARLVTTAIAAGALFLAPSFPNLSRAALAVVVIGTVVEAVDWRASRGVWHFSHQEAFLGGVAFMGVLTLGLVLGMLLAAIASILLLIYRAAHPNIVQLGEAPDHPEGFG
ncbi:SulP family inorganic anion transporter, partial [Pyxidicoccus sp. 3LFB2]